MNILRAVEISIFHILSFLNSFFNALHFGLLVLFPYFLNSPYFLFVKYFIVRFCVVCLWIDGRKLFALLRARQCKRLVV